MHFCHYNLLCGVIAMVGGQGHSEFRSKYQDHRHTASIWPQDDEMAIFCATFSVADQASDTSVAMGVVIVTIPAELVQDNIQKDTAALDAHLSEQPDCFYGKKTLSAMPKDINWIKLPIDKPIEKRVTEILPQSLVPITSDSSITAKPVWQPVQVTATTGFLKATNAATPAKPSWALYSSTALMIAGSTVLALVLGYVGWSLPVFFSF